MAISTGILANDLRRMASAGPAQLGARVSHDPNLLAEDEFRRTHQGMDRLSWAAREKMLQQERYEADALSDLDGEAPPIDGLPSGLSAKRKAYAAFAVWLKGEEQKLALLENKRHDLQTMVDAPAEAEGNIRAMLRRTADALLHGTPADESDAAKRLELETRHTAQRHRAEAATMALADLEPQIEVARLRVDRLRSREMEYLAPVMHEKRMIRPLSNWHWYGMTTIEPPSQHVEIKWRSSWSEIAEILSADSVADISKLLPVVKL
jgi:hypothetical protein